jgi:acyl-CoA synthetase (AMP-forming)/AMP-acid ligase II
MTSIQDALGRLWNAADGTRMFQCDGQWVAWGQVRSLTERIDRELTSAGCGGAGRVAVVLGNRMESVAALIAIFRANRTLVTISPLRQARRHALLAVAADSIGVGSRALAMAVEWACEREQFGRPIGSFQAISHRCADILVALEGARSQVTAASDAEPAADDEESEYLVDLAATAAFDAAVPATEGAVQIHGGIGFTWGAFRPPAVEASQGKRRVGRTGRRAA